MGGRVPGAEAPCFSAASNARTKVRAYLRSNSNSNSNSNDNDNGNGNDNDNGKSNGKSKSKSNGKSFNAAGAAVSLWTRRKPGPSLGQDDKFNK